MIKIPLEEFLKLKFDVHAKNIIKLFLAISFAPIMASPFIALGILPMVIIFVSHVPFNEIFNEILLGSLGVSYSILSEFYIYLGSVYFVKFLFDLFRVFKYKNFD